jgi:hypothetical protein
MKHSERLALAPLLFRLNQLNKMLQLKTTEQWNQMGDTHERVRLPMFVLH